MTVTFSKQAIKALSRMDAPTKRRIQLAILGIPEGDIKPLQGYHDGRQRLRVGKYRVVFSVAEEHLRVYDIGARGDIYKG